MPCSITIMPLLDAIDRGERGRAVNTVVRQECFSRDNTDVTRPGQRPAGRCALAYLFRRFSPCLGATASALGSLGELGVTTTMRLPGRFAVRLCHSAAHASA